MLEKIASAFSYAFHPLLAPTIALIILFNTGTYLSYISYDIQKSIYIIVFISTFVLPLSFMPFLLYNQKIKDILLKNRHERIIPLAIAAFFYGFAFYILQNLNAPKVIRLFMMGATISVVLALFVTFFWKISTHMIGTGGLLAIIVIISNRLMIDIHFLLIVFILITGFIGSARLYLHAHDSLQVYGGIILGFLSVCLPFYIF